MGSTRRGVMCSLIPAVRTVRRGRRAIMRVARLSRTIAANVLRPAGLYPGQESVMMNLWELGPQRQADLIRLNGSDAATMTRTIRRLEHAGFVRRTPSPDDKRAFLIEATPASRGLRSEVSEMWRQLDEILVGGLSKQERQTVLRVIEDMEKRLSRAVSPRPPRRPRPVLGRHRHTSSRGQTDDRGAPRGDVLPCAGRRGPLPRGR
jgi:DNA-binding MarR family transcriptional regulator